MARAGGWVVAAGVAAAGSAWLATPVLPSPARLLTVFLVSFLPALLVLQGRMLRTAELDDLPRLGVYLSSSVALWLLAGVTAAAALASGFELRTLGIVALPAGPLIAWSAFAVVSALGVTVATRYLGARETALTEHVLPRTRQEKRAFVGVALTAGVCEELVFRSFLIPALLAASGSLGLAVLVSSAVFGLLHGYQGAVGILRTGVLGLLMAVPFVMTGSILPSMLAHFVLDLILGLWLADWLLGGRR